MRKEKISGNFQACYANGTLVLAAKGVMPDGCVSSIRFEPVTPDSIPPRYALVTGRNMMGMPRRCDDWSMNFMISR